MSSISPAEAARIWAVLKALERFVKEWQDGFKPDALKVLADAGIERVKAALPEGDPVAHVTYVAPPEPSLKVADEEAYVGWLRENLSGYVVHTPSQIIAARDDAMPQALDLFSVDDGGNVVYPTTGELVPGLLASRRKPYLTTKFTLGGELRVLDALRRGRMDELLMLADATPEEER